MSTIFISHSSQDTVWCQEFVTALHAAGHSCIFAHDSISSSAEWLATVQEGAQKCDFCMLVLSPIAWASPRVRRSWHLVLLQNKPILPVEYQLTPEANGGFLGQCQWVKAIGLDAASAAQRAVVAAARLGYDGMGSSPPSIVSQTSSSHPVLARLTHLGFMSFVSTGVEYIIPPVRTVPAGHFIMGSDLHCDSQAYDNELHQYRIRTDMYQIGVYPLTVAEYACAVIAQAIKAPPDKGSVTWQHQQQHPDHPVVCVSWHDVRAYSAWLTKLTGQAWRLPTEAEWEKAARGTDGRIYPWGNHWDEVRADTTDGGPQTTTPIGTYTGKGAESPYGVHDMMGNVSEWTNSIFQPYPYRVNAAENDADISSERALRGSRYGNHPRYSRTAFRNRDNPKNFYAGLSARLVRVAASGYSRE